MAHIIDKDRLPPRFPTHRHTDEFWEELGRVVATFDFLEEVLGKAIFAFAATRSYAHEDIDAAFEAWLPTLKRALSDPLGNLIDVYAKSVREHPASTIENLDELTENLHKSAKLRNVLCHGSWRLPDESGASVPLFVNRNEEKFETAIDLECLRQTQAEVAEMACEVIDTVTRMGWKFPGKAGPGEPIL